MTAVEPAMSKKVLFLDIDGVLHPNGTVSVLPDGSVSGPGAFRWISIFESHMQAHPDVSVVVHSSWRLLWETDQELKNQFPEILAERIIGATPRLVMGRYASIQAYCAGQKIQRHVILDDEPHAFPEGLPELVVCDATLGISSRRTGLALFRALAEL